MKFYSKPVAEHGDVPLADDGRLEEIIDRWTQHDNDLQGIKSSGENRTYVISVSSSRNTEERNARLQEILNLVSSQGDLVAGHEMVFLARPRPRAYLGSGRAAEIAANARASSASMLAIDAELSPSQLRNLEDACGLPVCDREAIILNVFLRNARSKQSRIQVEIAQLEYLRPRIRGVGINMDQQTGGLKGGRGPGETASELLARKIDFRLDSLRAAFRKIVVSCATQRQLRGKGKRIVLIGYTNAGKTSLMNALTGSQLSSRDALFETLDTTSRGLSRHGGTVLISDTVGFIRNLPERLFESFESTLAEVKEASMLVLVVDISDSERLQHIRTTMEVLEKLGVSNTRKHFVFNKADKLIEPLQHEDLERLARGSSFSLLSSADATAVRDLKSTLLRMVKENNCSTQLIIPYERADVLSLVYRECRIIESSANDLELLLTVEADSALLTKITRLLKVQQ